MKNLFKSILIGVLSGIAILILSYVGVYHIEGQEVFEKEVLQLTQYNVLQSQLIATAIYGALFVTTISTMAKLIENEDKAFYKPILGSILFIIVESILGCTIVYMEQFSENIKSMLVINHVLIIVTYMLARGVITFWEQFIINKKIKEKSVT